MFKLLNVYIYIIMYDNILSINVIKSLNPTRFLEKGTHSICLMNDKENIVIKYCLKANHTILKTYDMFIEFIDKLKNSNINKYILYPIKIYDYSESHIIYVKNFCIYNNNIYIYDIHNIESFTSEENTCNFLVTNIFNNLIKYLNIDSKIYHFKQILSLQFGKTLFPEIYYNILYSLYILEYSKTLEYINVLLNESKIHRFHNFIYSDIYGNIMFNTREYTNRIDTYINMYKPKSVSSNNIEILLFISKNYPEILVLSEDKNIFCKFVNIYHIQNLFYICNCNKNVFNVCELYIHINMNDETQNVDPEYKKYKKYKKYIC